MTPDCQFKHHRICTGLVPQPSSTATQHLTSGIQNHWLLGAQPARFCASAGGSWPAIHNKVDVHRCFATCCHIAHSKCLQITLITSIIPPTQPKLHPPLAVNPDPQVVPPTHHLCSGMLDDQQNVETPCTNLYKIFGTYLEHFASEPWNLHNK